MAGRPLVLGEGGAADTRPMTVDDDWQAGPLNRWAFQHVSALLPTETLSRGSGPVCELPVAPIDISGASPRLAEGAAISINEWLERTSTDAIVVLREGWLAWEQYRNGMSAATPHLLMSVSKTMTAMLAGILVDRGVLDRDARAGRYVPMLSGSAYEDATIQQVLDMQVAVQYSEDYLDPHSEAQELERVSGWRPLRQGETPGMRGLLSRLRKKGEHGQAFEYTSATTDVLGWIIEEATGEPFAELFSRALWSRLGAANDAYITVDHFGAPIVDGGICCAPRDLARFGQMLLDQGRYNDQQIVPAWWIDDTRFRGNREAFRRSPGPGRRYSAGGSYRNCTWITGNEESALYAFGIYGQNVWIDPTNRVVIAKFSSQPQPLDRDLDALQHAGMAAIARAIGS